jgi:nicotinate-nucleotide adenylyltransferase
MGGTFDPIHIGHLVAGEEARYQFGLDRILFVPSARPPHKTERHNTPTADRLRMAELAVLGNDRLGVSDIEARREGLSYTIDTLRSLHAMHGAATELYFITGADAILEILTWKDPAELLAEAYFIAATRPGYPLEKLQEALPRLNSQGEATGSRVFTLEVPALAISSTDIRARVAEGRPFRYLVPDPVWSYITENRLYL